MTLNTKTTELSQESVFYLHNFLAGQQQGKPPHELLQDPWKKIITTAGSIADIKKKAKKLEELVKQQQQLDYEKIMRQILALDPQKLSQKPRTHYTCEELMNSDFPSPTYIIDQFIQKGKSTLLASKPKMRKSFLGTQAAVAIATGNPMFGPQGKAAKKGKTVYFALEDPPGRVKKRLKDIGIDKNLDILFIFRGDFPPIDKGGDEFLRELIAKEKPSLIVIDTISKIYSGKFDENKAECCLAVFPKIRAIADETGTAFLLIHHHKKGFSCSGDPRDDYRGSSAIAGDVDIIAGIYNENGQKILRMMGNDLEEDIEWVIEFDKVVKLGWSIAGKAEDVAMSDCERNVVEALEEMEQADAKQLARKLRKKDNTVKAVLRRLVNKDKIMMTKKPTATGSKKNVYSLIKKDDIYITHITHITHLTHLTVPLICLCYALVWQRFSLVVMGLKPFLEYLCQVC